MTRQKHAIPKNTPVLLTKRSLIEGLMRIDADPRARERILELETAFRARVKAHIATAPNQFASLREFSTNPFVLMIHCMKRKYSRISEIDKDILPAKEFSSMETSAGRMIEEVALPVYGWQLVPSGMHTVESVLDGMRKTRDTLYVATLKSGPRCLNDEMSENFADSIIKYSSTWARTHGGGRIDFTYGVLYGTPSLSNKKDWHILRNIVEKVAKENRGVVVKSHAGSWSCVCNIDGVEVVSTVRIGKDWWNHLGQSDLCLVELCVALIRACVKVGDMDASNERYLIGDLQDIVSIKHIPDSFNVSLIQRSQLPWLFFIIKHFCDDLS